MHRCESGLKACSDHKINLTRFLLFLPQIRMQAHGSTIQGGMIGNFISIYQQEGTRGLWKVKHLLSIDGSWPSPVLRWLTHLCLVPGSVTHCTESCYSSGCGVTSVWHHQETSHHVRTDGRHDLYTLSVSTEQSVVLWVLYTFQWPLHAVPFFFLYIRCRVGNMTAKLRPCKKSYSCWLL